MTPDYETMTGGGQLTTSEISVNGLNTLQKLADLIKVDQLKNLEIGDDNSTLICDETGQD